MHNSMNNQIVILLFMFLSFSCSKDRSTNNEPNNLEETPEVLEENKGDLNLSSYSKRAKKDIIQQLYDEAVDKDEQLKSLNSRISEISDLKKDSLKDFETYIRNNQNYWNSIDGYASQLSDTTLRDELKNLIEVLEKKHASKMSPLNSIVKQIEVAEQSLRDQEILMKILVTEPMMSNYQRNEFPDINTLKSVKSSLDTLINDVKPYAQIRK